MFISSLHFVKRVLKQKETEVRLNFADAFPDDQFAADEDFGWRGYLLVVYFFNQQVGCFSADPPFPDVDGGQARIHNCA